MKNKPQNRPGKETTTQSKKGFVFFVNGIVIPTVFNFLSSFCLNKSALSPPEGQSYSTEIIYAFGLHAEYEEEYIEPQQKPKRKIKK